MVANEGRGEEEKRRRDGEEKRGAARFSKNLTTHLCRVIEHTNGKPHACQRCGFGAQCHGVGPQDNKKEGGKGKKRGKSWG